MRAKFGPSGNSQEFYDSGFKHTNQAPAWLKTLGLELFEYSFGRGITISEAGGKAIAEQAEANGIEISVHAPYFINLAVEDQERIDKNINYFISSAQSARYLGAKRIVFHPGGVAKIAREKAMGLAVPFLGEIFKILQQEGYGDIIFCAETMGKINQLGNLDEILSFCEKYENLLPCIDFGHLHARDLGALNSKADFKEILDEMINRIGVERTSKMHIHFSKIEYGKGGEKRHRTFEEEEFGPNFEPLAELLSEMNLAPHILCESNGTMAKDALYMQSAYIKCLEKGE